MYGFGIMLVGQLIEEFESLVYLEAQGRLLHNDFVRRMMLNLKACFPLFSPMQDNSRVDNPGFLHICFNNIWVAMKYL